MTGNHSLHNDDDEDDDQTLSSGPQHEPQQQQQPGVLSRASSVATGPDDDNESAVTTLTAAPPTSTPKKTLASSSVQVAVRVRPLLSSLESGCGSCIHVVPPTSSSSASKYATTIQIGSSSGPRFTFDEVFAVETQQAQVFDHRVAPLVESCLQGYNASLLAYGQTGSGKTHTVIGPSTCQALPDSPASGMIPRAVNQLFHELQDKLVKAQQQQQQQQPSGTSSTTAGDTKGSATSSAESSSSADNNESNDNVSYEFQVRVQFLELYGEEIRDLLVMASSNTEVLKIRDIGNDEPEVVGATSQVVESAEEALRCLTKGMLRRVTAATAMNEASSRSHAIFSILIDQTWNTTTTTTTAVGVVAGGDGGSSAAGAAAVADANKDATEGTGQQVRRSKFNFVDLAGSERQKRTQASGRRLKEGIDINKGLLVLGNVISALGDPKKRGKAFVPYRDSKLTRLLKGSLGGNHKTLMIACVSPASTNMEESLNCLRYANRAKNIQNHAVVNVDARSGLITQLKHQVQALATDLLKVHDDPSTTAGNNSSSFTRQDLVALASGGAAAENINAAGPATAVSSSSPSATTPTTVPQLVSPVSAQMSNKENLEQLQRLQETEEELNRTRTQLKKNRRENVAVEERLHVTQAEKEFYRLQLDAVTEDDDNSTTSSGETNKKTKLDQVFVDRASQYEKEIDRLKDELRVVRSKLVEQRDPNEDDNDTTAALSIQKASKGMKAERERLSFLQNELLSVNSPTPGQTTHRGGQRDGAEEDDRNDVVQVDSEEKAEQEHLSALTLKYSTVDDEDEVMVVNDQDGSLVGGAGLSLEQAEAKVSEQRRAQIEADLLEISRIIESKEDLISQLECSQAKYSSMKGFYEGKLHQMEQLLDQKEEERQKIIIEMERLQENNHDTKEIEAQLKKKDEHIAGIRKQKRQLKDLTAVSSKNAAEINKLQNDVKSMKERKVSMQKQLTEERKAHANEMKRLKKEMLQKDRETRKWQKISNQKTTEAEKASQMAKNKTAQLGQLRSKYKDAEKTIRMLQIKKGVMAKAGLEPVMVGRREVGKDPGIQSRSRSDGRSMDIDLVREYFDFKVGEVGRKESLADKLARGWEEHFQLTLERSELAEQESEESKEGMQALDLRIQYEEERIRKLANRIGKGQAHNSDDDGKSGQPSSILYGEEFKRLCKGVSAAKASEIAAKVLFGMVVRERRRIASLAKTASSLDEKLQECQMDNEAKEFAFRSYVQDSQQDLANVSMNHQEQILSLMSIVKGEKDPSTVENTDAMGSSARSESIGLDLKESSDLLVLANERITVLEQQLRDMRAEKKVSETYRLEKEEVLAALDEKADQYEKLDMQCAGLRATLRQIRSLLADGKNDESLANSEEAFLVFKTCLAVIRETLRESPMPMSPMTRRHSSPGIFLVDSFSPRSRRKLDFVKDADDDAEDEEETPEWADEIMADLAIIAEGRLPPSLLNLPDILDGDAAEEQENSISEPPKAATTEAETIERLLEIQATTPTEGLTQASNPVDSAVLSTLDAPVLTDTTKGSPETEKTFAQSVAPTSSVTTEELGESGSRNEVDAEGKSVFERLVNPTNFTGTQKEKHHGQSGVQKERQESAAERILDHLLESEAELPRVRPAEAPSSNKVNEYTQQNVFERLQKTTTQSFAVKHASDALQEANPSQPIAAVPQKQESTKGAKSVVEARPKRNLAPSAAQSAATATAMDKSPGRAKNRSTGIATNSRARTPSRQSDSPTRARASGIRPPQVKSPPRLKDSSPARTKTPPKIRNKDKEEYAQQNVFERLTKKTTEAYAVKKRVVKN